MDTKPNRTKWHEKLDRSDQILPFLSYNCRTVTKARTFAEALLFQILNSEC